MNLLCLEPLLHQDIYFTQTDEEMATTTTAIRDNRPGRVHKIALELYTPFRTPFFISPITQRYGKSDGTRIFAKVLLG